jgi:16S rRNA (cytosine1402-N4)-methyltransferase
VTHAGKNSSTSKHCSPTAEPADTQNSPQIHIPVLLDEAIRLLAPFDGGIYVDGTLGLGGHTEKILQSCSPSGRVIGFEWDTCALELAEKKLSSFGKRFTAQHRSYSEIMEGLSEMGIQKVDGLLLDLGVSSLQFDNRKRGFSFQADGPLDMRMDKRQNLTAEKIINSFNKEDLADIFYYFGEERQSRRIASHIVDERKKEHIATTTRLAQIVAAAIPRKFHPRKIHVATKVFQALRIAVNRELDNLTALLDSVTKILKPDGRICIITFHSLEDRLVKWKFKDNQSLHILTKKPVIPGDQEIKANPRARSAKLRAAYMKG